MKTKDYLKTLREKDAAGLKAELASLCKEQFNLRMQLATGQQSKNHLVRVVRHNIARVKTMIQQAESA